MMRKMQIYVSFIFSFCTLVALEAVDPTLVARWVNAAEKSDHDHDLGHDHDHEHGLDLDLSD